MTNMDQEATAAGVQQANVSRSVARLSAVQALYQLAMSGGTTEAIIGQFSDHEANRRSDDDGDESIAKADSNLFAELVRGTSSKMTEVDEPGLLFHLAEDPRETKNLADLYPDKVEELRGIVDEVKSPPATGKPPAAAKSAEAWPAPVKSITNVVSTPQEGIHFASSGKASWRISGEMPARSTTVVLRP